METPADRIKKYIEDSGIKQKYICIKSGMNGSTLSLKLNNKRRLTANDIEAICHALGCTPNKFIKKRAKPQKEKAG